MTVAVSRLANGLRIATDRMEGVESATVGVWVGAGTRNEPAHVNGVAHLLEHMAFKGTERRSARAIAEEIEAVGGHLNAYTSRESTAYYAKVLAGDLGLAIDILADILQRSVFEPEELERERTVILQEIGQAADTPDDIIFDFFQETAFPDQALGRPILGSSGTIGRIARGEVKDYMRSRYGASSMVLAAAGAVEHRQLVELAERAFGALPTAADLSFEAARYRGGERREERDLEQVHLVLGFAGVEHRSRDVYAASVLSTLLGGGMSSRLFQEVREKRGLVYSIYTFASSYLDGGLFGLYAGTGEKEVAEMLPLVCEEIVKVRRGAPEDELRRARAQVGANLLMARESTGARAEQLAHQLLVYGRPLPVPEILAEIDAVDGGRLAEVAGILTSSPPTMAAIGPVAQVEPLERIRARLAAGAP
jgi:predicted Zn-dependent peptidase